MALASELLVVAVTVAADVEDDWNRWYDGVHLPEIAACPGFLSAQRYVADEPGGRRYLTVYELRDASALDSAEFKARRGWGPFADKVDFRTSRYSRIAQIASTGGAA
jgi:antibiotic biosynthesis monooxygenase (ABM) superfamily enzyme